MDNPHYSFYFPGNDALRKVNKTVIDWPDRRISEENFRAPSLNRKTGEVIRNDAWLTQALQQQGQSFSIALWQMLNPKYPENVERSWDYFSNHDTVYNDPKFNSDPDPKKDNLRRIQTSLEAWHDNIHGMIGQGRGVQGHMGNPAIASFDPIFWLHHNNMERLFALYQALYDEHQKNEQYFVSETTTSKFPKATRNTELSPFERVKGTSYTSKEVRDWRVDGYAVPGDGGREAAEKYIQTNYYW